MKTEEDADTHSRSSAGQQRRKQRSKTPELRLTRSMQPPQELHPHNPPANERRTGKSLPVKLEQQGAAGEAAALHQGSSGSPGKGTAGSGSQQNGAAKRRGSKGLTVKQGDAAVKAEVSSSRLRQSAGGASTSGESQSHIDLAAACQDQGDAVGSSGKLLLRLACNESFGLQFSHPRDNRRAEVLQGRHTFMKPFCCLHVRLNILGINRQGEAAQSQRYQWPVTQHQVCCKAQASAAVFGSAHIIKSDHVCTCSLADGKISHLQHIIVRAMRQQCGSWSVLCNTGRRGSNSAAAGLSKRTKLPAKNPMVLQKQNGSYYRVRVLKEELHRVKIGESALPLPSLQPIMHL